MCIYCKYGAERTKLRRQWVHHFPDTGRLIICVEAAREAAMQELADQAQELEMGYEAAPLKPRS